RVDLLSRGAEAGKAQGLRAFQPLSPRTGRSSSSARRACLLPAYPLSLARRPRNPGKVRNAPLPLFSADPARNAEGSGNHIAPAHAAGRHDAAGGGRNLCVPSARLPCAAEDLPDRARRTEPVGSYRAADADHSVSRSLARKRPL